MVPVARIHLLGLAGNLSRAAFRKLKRLSPPPQAQAIPLFLIIRLLSLIIVAMPQPRVLVVATSVGSLRV